MNITNKFGFFWAGLWIFLGAYFILSSTDMFEFTVQFICFVFQFHFWMSSFNFDKEEIING